MNIENMDDNQMDDSLVFKPDLDVVYPNKQELYRKEKASPVITIKRLMVAASMIFAVGIIWWLNQENKQQQVVAVMPKGSNRSLQDKSAPRSINEVEPVNVFVVNNAKKIRKKESVPVAVVSVPEVLPDNSIKEIASTVVIQEEIVNQVVERPRSNFSEEALQSAQLIAQQSSSKAIPQEEKVEVYIPMTMQQERKKPFRGLVRKLSRTILGEGESFGEEENIIRVANVKIPVSQ